MRYRGEASSDPSACFPKEDYFLTCTNVQDKDKEGNPLKSKKGNDMWILELTVAEGPHKDRKLWHYLVWLLAGAPGHGMTLKCLKAFGIDPEGDNDILPEHLLNLTVKATVGIDDKDSQYEPKNVIVKWHNPGELKKPGDTSFNTEELEKAGQGGQTALASVPPAQAQPQAAATPAQAPAPAQAAGGKKPLWGGKAAK